MRGAIVGLVVVAAGCGGGDDVVPISPWPEARIDVEVRALGVHVSAIEVDHPDVCSQHAFLATGCDDTSDATACSGNPASWIEHVELRAGDRTIGRASWADQSGGRGVGLGFGDDAGHDDLTLAIYTIDAGHTDVRIPDTTIPAAPTVDAVTWDGATVHVAWSSAPDAASAVVAISNGFAGRRCHVGAGTAVDFAWTVDQQPSPPTPPADLIITSYAAPVVDTNALGSVTMWIASDPTVTAVPRD